MACSLWNEFKIISYLLLFDIFYLLYFKYYIQTYAKLCKNLEIFGQNYITQKP